MITWVSSKSPWGAEIFHTSKECLERCIKWNSLHINTEIAHPVEIDIDELSSSRQRFCSRCSKGVKL